MDYQVIYFSKTSNQNTKRIAEILASALKVTATRITPNTQLQRSKLLFIGSGVYMWRAGKGILDFVNNLPQTEGQKAAIFMTHGGNKEQAMKGLKEKLEEKGIEVVATWDCLGQWAFFARGHPTADEEDGARNFALETAKKAENTEGAEKGELETVEKPL